MKFQYKKLAADILAKREKDNLTFRKIEKDTRKKLSATTLQRVEAGTQVPKADTLGDICHWLGKPIQNYFA